MNRILLTVSAVLLASTVWAQPESEPARLANDVIHSLALATDARIVLSAVESTDDSVLDSLNAITATRRAITKVTSANNLLTPYAESSNELIAQTATFFRNNYSVLFAAFTGNLVIQQKFVDITPGDSFGSLLSDASEYTAMSEDAWKALPNGAALLSHALVDGDRAPGFLLITRQERIDLLHTIEFLFSEGVAAGEAVGLHYPEGAAAMFAKFLRQPWRGSDQR